MSKLADEVAVEVMGWYIPRGNTPGGCMWVDANELLRYHVSTWSPDTQGDHMLMVHEKMLADGYVCHISAGPQGDHNVYYVKWPVGPSTKARIGVGRTLPEAISNAALAAKRAGDET